MAGELTSDPLLNVVEGMVRSSCHSSARHDRWHERGEKHTKAHSVHSMAGRTFLHG